MKLCENKTYYLRENKMGREHYGCRFRYEFGKDSIYFYFDVKNKDIKPKILKISPKGLGKNPDILLNKENIVGLSSRIKKESYNTGKRLIEFIGR